MELIHINWTHIRKIAVGCSRDTYLSTLWMLRNRLRNRLSSHLAYGARPKCSADIWTCAVQRTVAVAWGRSIGDQIHCQFPILELNLDSVSLNPLIKARARDLFEFGWHQRLFLVMVYPLKEWLLSTGASRFHVGSTPADPQGGEKFNFTLLPFNGAKWHTWMLNYDAKNFIQLCNYAQIAQRDSHKKYGESHRINPYLRSSPNVFICMVAITRPEQLGRRAWFAPRGDR